MSDLIIEWTERERLQVMAHVQQQAARIERLEAALREISDETGGYRPDMTEDEARRYFSSPLFLIQQKARAALEDRT